MALTVTKMSGTQNTFFILDAQSSDFNAQIRQIFSGLTRSQVAQKLCQSSYFSKADGCIYIEKDPFVDFKWDFYNADGSPAEMCGNAARCVAQWIYDQKSLSSIKFRSVSGIIQADILSKGFVQVQMNAPHIVEYEKTLIYKKQPFKGLSVNTGVPHFVIATEKDFKNDQSYLKDVSKYIRKHPDFGKEGCNVSWLQTKDMEASKNIFTGLTFERGVEDFTKACGTGAVALSVFLISRSLQPFQQDITICVPGGQLIVKVDQDYKNATLSGAVEYLEQFDMTDHQKIIPPGLNDLNAKLKDFDL